MKEKTELFVAEVTALFGVLAAVMAISVGFGALLLSLEAEAAFVVGGILVVSITAAHILCGFFWARTEGRV
jgi:hypothetical protein